MWIRTGAKGNRLMQNGEPEAKVVGSVLTQEGRSAAHMDCSEHVFPAPKTPDPAGKPCGLLSCGGSAEIQTHPLCVHSTLNLLHRAPHLGCSLILQTCQVWGSAAQDPRAPTVTQHKQECGWRENALCYQVQKRTKVGQGSESMHRHPSNQGFSPQRQRGCSAVPEEAEQEQRRHRTANVHIH